MGENTSTQTRWLRSRPASPGFSPDKIDADAGIIRDVVMVEEGPAKGHNVSLEAEFIRDLVSYDRRTFGDRGVKARLGHPSMSSDAMGTQLGFYRNIRERQFGNKWQAIGDLHLLDSANASPDKPGARDWVLQMAKEAPDFIMSSIVFKPGAYYQRKPDGKKHKLERDLDPESRSYWLNYRQEYGVIYVEFSEHYNTDLVEQGAATDHLFSHDANPHLFVVQAEEFLQEHPDILDFFQKHPDKVRAFMDRLLAQDKTQTDMSDPKQPITIEAESLAEQLESAKAEGAHEEAKRNGAQAAAFENRVEQLETQLGTLQTTVTQYEDKFKKQEDAIAALTARLTALENAPAAEHTNGDQDNEVKQQSDTPHWDKLRAKIGV